MAEAIFEVVADSYQDRKVKYSVGEILTVVMCSVSIGNRSIRGICELNNRIGIVERTALIRYGTTGIGNIGFEIISISIKCAIT